MKTDLLLALQDAEWPVLLVNAAGAICQPNRAALALFGPMLTSGTAQLSTIWSADNLVSAEQFLADWPRSPSPVVWLKFRDQAAKTVARLVSLCAFEGSQQKGFLFQLLPQAVQLNTETPAQTAENQAHKQKLECALQLARTISLDFNNALTSILGHTSLLLSKMEPDHPWRGAMMEVEKSATKAADLANDLGAFSRQEKEPRGQAAGNLNALLQRTVESFQKNGGGAARWTLQLERKLFSAKFDEAKMQQALARIIENSVESLAAEGRITIQTRNLELHEPTQDRNARLAPGAYVSVEIADNGCGIAPEVLPRVFEPFFTTKKESKHRGLGLAWVYGIITNHGGGVAVSSQPGRGTSVRLYLPAEKKIVKDNSTTAAELGGTETILMVDDEDLLLRMGQTILSSYGYHVLTAGSGQKALDLLSTNGKPVHLVLTDLVMPGMSGRELVESIHQQWPAMRILCSSGYSSPSQQENNLFLQKPFTTQELLLKVKEALSA